MNSLSDNIKRNIQDRADSEFNDLMIDNKELKIKLDLDDVASSNYKETIDFGINEKEINEYNNLKKFILIYLEGIIRKYFLCF